MTAPPWSDFECSGRLGHICMIVINLCGLFFPDVAVGAFFDVDSVLPVDVHFYWAN